MKVQQRVPVLDGDQPSDRAIRIRIGINIRRAYREPSCQSCSRPYVHTNDTSFGTFDAKVSTGVDATMIVEGQRRISGGTGSFSKLKGSGIFKASMTSPTDSEMTWSGSYEA